MSEQPQSHIILVWIHKNTLVHAESTGTSAYFNQSIKKENSPVAYFLLLNISTYINQTSEETNSSDLQQQPARFWGLCSE